MNLTTAFTLLKIVAIVALLPLVAVAALVMTFVDILTPSNWN